MLKDFYQAELTYLRELGALYAQQNPGIAGMLADRGSDPDVERLIEAFAFLTARIRERLEDGAPEIVHNLAELVLPHYVRGVPAASIVEFQPVAGSLRKRQTIPRFAELASNPVNGTQCRFRTTADTDVLPISIADVKLDEPSLTRPRLHLSIESTTKEGRLEVFQAKGLRLFLHGEPATTATVYLWINRYLRAIYLRGAGKTDELALSPEHVVASGLDPSMALLPWPEYASDGYRIIQEYFVLPQKMLFFDLVKLEAARERIRDDRFEIVFEFGPTPDAGDPPRLPASISKGSVRLHCAPVVNLFSTSAEPLKRNGDSSEHLLRAAGLHLEHAQIYTVDLVKGIRQGEKPRTYQPFHAFGHGATSSHTSGGTEFYRLRRVPSPLNDGIDTFLSVVTPRDVEPQHVGAEDISIKVTATNRDLPNDLRAGDISRPTSTSPAFATFKNIIPVSRSRRPPIGTELEWRLIAHLAINRQSMTDDGMIPALLALYDFAESGDEASARNNRLKIEAIRQVSVEPTQRLIRGTPVRGMTTTIEVNESGVGSPGEAFMFGTMLDEFLASRVAMNTFNELILRLTPSGRMFRWAPRSGRQKVL